jgi:hypothetical protein
MEATREGAETPMTRNTVKAAELASSLGAMVLGAGLALLAPALLSAYALPILAAGIAVHGAGMTLKHRLDSAGRAPLWWEQALFWACWLLLAFLAAWLLVRLTNP